MHGGTHVLQINLCEIDVCALPLWFFYQFWWTSSSQRPMVKWHLFRVWTAQVWVWGGTGRSLIRPASLHGLFWCFCNERLLGRVNSQTCRGPFDVKWCERRRGWKRRGGGSLRKEWMLRGPARSGRDEERLLRGWVAAAGDILSRVQEGVELRARAHSGFMPIPTTGRSEMF